MTNWTTLYAWILGVSTGIWIMSAIWMSHSARSIKRSERHMSEIEQQLTNDVTAARLRRDNERGDN